MQHEEFYEEPTAASIAKIKIVADYFSAWSKVILPHAKKQNDSRVAFLDLFSGPGRYKDGTASTPLWILGSAVNNVDLRNHLVMHFNDVDTATATTLEHEIQSFPGVNQLRYQPTVTNFEVGREVAKSLSAARLIPTLFFIDPWGYKGLSLDLLGSAIQHWGCDCIFFFNYNRVNPGVSNPMVEELINDLFGAERADLLREKVSGTSGHIREMVILNEMLEAVREGGGSWVLPFTFRNRIGNRTSHHLIFISKHFRGFDIMKDVMAGVGRTTGEDFLGFEFNPAPSIQLGFLDRFYREQQIELLEGWLLSHFSKRDVKMKDLYEEHELSRRGTVFRKVDYKSAIRNLESKGLVYLDVPADRRQKHNGEVTVGDSRTVYFPAD